MGSGGDDRLMPWRQTCTVDQRVALVAEWLHDEWTMTELAERYGVSRKTAYKWVERYEAAGAPGLADRSRAPCCAHGRRRSSGRRPAR